MASQPNCVSLQGHQQGIKIFTSPPLHNTQCELPLHKSCYSDLSKVRDFVLISIFFANLSGSDHLITDWISFYAFSSLYIKYFFLLIFFIFKFSFIYFGYSWVLVAALKIFIAICGFLSCSMQDLAPQAGIQPGSLALGALSFTHWTISKFPD